MGPDSRDPIHLGKTYKVVCRAMCVKLFASLATTLFPKFASSVHFLRNFRA